MVDYREVRVGNWVQRSGGGQHKMITVEDFWQYYVDPLKGFYYYEPIPLSPEILLACGYHNDHGEGDMCWLSKELMGDEKLKYALELLNINDGGFEILGKYSSVKYLHQLQNLYFVITGKELVYQPTPQPA